MWLCFERLEGLADDVVAAVVNGDNKSEFSLGSRTNGHPISYCHRIGGADAFETEVTFHATFHDIAFLGANHVAAPRVAHHNAV